MLRDDCLAKANPPGLEVGSVLKSGSFWRNLKSSDIKRRYMNDMLDPPEYGFRVLFNCLYGWTGEPYELSVNIRSCTDCICSIHLHPKPCMFKHVGLIDINQLSERIGMKVVAVYTPTHADPEDDESAIVNPCHFDLSPEGDIDIFCSCLQDVSWIGFPTPTAQSPKKPTNEAEITQAKDAQSLFENTISIHLNVLCSD
jgi:hypothetical protein